MINISKTLKAIGLLLLFAVTVNAQAPQKFNYQAIARNAGGAELTGQSLGIRVSILDGSPGGTIVYQETHTKTTNNFGLFNLEVGEGTVVSGSFANIGWGNGPKYIKTEIDPAGGNVYTVAGTSQLISVPYAIYAGNSGGGNQGPTGPQGPQGPNGTNGANGAVGPTGPQGIQGPQGSTGSVGPQGPAGADGATGPQGPAGADGAVGPQGPAGADGAVGPQGPAGADGAVGPQGPAGADGAVGPQGPAGADGAVGPQGPAGADGADGPTGPTGILQDGDSAGDTPYWDGSAWVTTSSNIYNNGANVGIGTTTPASKLGVAGNLSIGQNFANSAAPANGLMVEGFVKVNAINPLTPAANRGANTSNVYVERSANDFGAGYSNIFAFREGSSNAADGGTSWAVRGVDAALKGYSFNGNNFTAGVYGANFGTYANSAGVVGRLNLGNNSNPTLAFVAYKDAQDNYWGFHTRDNVLFGADVVLPQGAQTGYVLTSSNNQGVAVWAPAPTGGVGPQGPQGPAGADGVDGAVGPQGPAGANGATGATGPVAGTDKQVIFNDNGAAGADGEFTYDKTNNQLSVGGATANASAALDVTSTTRGFLMPRLTDAQRDAIASPADGLYIFNITTGCPNYYYNGDWYSTCGTVIVTVTPPGSQTFNYTGSVQQFTVPAGVTSITVDLLGASGGNSDGTASILGTGTNAGGLGGRTQTVLTVTSGQVLDIYVGGQGGFGAAPANAGGFNGGGNGDSYFDTFGFGFGTVYGGGGGGASDIRTQGGTFANRLAVAGGGGGAGYNTEAGNNGGWAADPNGQNGLFDTGLDITWVGLGATQSAGGTGATNLGLGNFGQQPSGTFGLGGNANNGSGTCGGGGGGGYYGGGASSFGGAGGGSSYVTPSGSSGIVYTPNVNTGNGTVTISW